MFNYLIYSAGDVIREELEDGSLVHNRFYAIFYELSGILASAYHSIHEIGWMLLILFAFLSIIMSGIVHNENKASSYKDWFIRILIAAAVFAGIPKLVGWMYVVGSSIGK